MNVVFLFVILTTVVAHENIHWNETVRVHYTDYKNTPVIEMSNTLLYSILNPKDFNLIKGKAIISYTFGIKKYSLHLIKYSYLQEKISKDADNKYSPAWNTKMVFGVFRVAFRSGASTCVSQEQAKFGLTYVDLVWRLLSGNRATVDFDSTYYSSKCVKGNYTFDAQTVINEAYLDGRNIDSKAGNQFTSRVYLCDDWDSGENFEGRAMLGEIQYFAQKVNMYALVKWNPIPTAKNDRKLLNLIHEISHNAGLGHANYIDPDQFNGFLSKYLYEDGYMDESNTMGLASAWYCIPGIHAYNLIITQLHPEPHYIQKLTGKSKETWRIFAWDYPYSRYFLGRDTANYKESDLIGGLRFDHNVFSVEVPYDKKGIYSKMDDGLLINGSLMIEYKWFPAGQRDWGNRGIRFTYGNVRKTDYNLNSDLYRTSMFVDIHWDNIYPSAQLPLGVTLYPLQDIGSLTYRITKSHIIDPSISITEEMIYKDIPTKIDYLDIPWVELEIDYNPNNPAKLPSDITPPLPTMKYSSNIGNCKNSGFNIECERINIDYFWTYMQNNGDRDVDTPRMYNQYSSPIRNMRFGSFSMLGGNYRTQYYYLVNGNYHRSSRRSFIKILSSFDNPTFPFYYCQKCQIFQNNNNLRDNEPYLEGNILLSNSIPLPTNGKIIVTDLYYTQMEIKQNEDGSVEQIIPDLKLQGFTVCFFMLKESDEIKYSTYYPFYIYHTDNTEKRIAYEFVVGKEDEFHIKPAVIPSNCHTQPGLFAAQRIKKNEMFIFPILYMGFKDYFFIDFEGSIANNLVITIETDNGNITKKLDKLNGIKDLSISITFIEIINLSFGYGQVYSFQFSDDINLLNIRPIYHSKNSNNPPNQAKKSNEKVSVGKKEYYIVNDDINYGYTFHSFKKTVNGKSYEFKSENDYYSTDGGSGGGGGDDDDNSNEGKNDKNKNMIYYIIGGVCGLIVICLVVCIICRCKSKASYRNSAAKQTNRYATTSIPNRYPAPSPSAGAYPPPQVNRYPPPPPASGYAYPAK